MDPCEAARMTNKELSELIHELRQLRRYPAGHGFKRRHRERHQSSRRFGVGSHGGKNKP